MAPQATPKEPTVGISLQILVSTDEKLRVIAKAMQIPATVLVRIAIEHLLDDPGHALAAIAKEARK